MDKDLGRRWISSKEAAELLGLQGEGEGRTGEGRWRGGCIDEELRREGCGAPTLHAPAAIDVTQHGVVARQSTTQESAAQLSPTPDANENDDVVTPTRPASSAADERDHEQRRPTRHRGMPKTVTEAGCTRTGRPLRNCSQDARRMTRAALGRALLVGSLYALSCRVNQRPTRGLVDPSL